MTARPRFAAEASRYAVTIARDGALVEEAQRLRHRVFAEEFGARLAGSPDGRDADRYDAWCDHLVVREAVTGRAVGTYRVLSPEAASRAGGYYSETEFDFTRLQSLRPRMAEVGRTCVEPAHRSGVVMLLLWSALARLAMDRGFEYLVGCASVGLGEGGRSASAVYRRLSVDSLSPEALRVLPRNPLPLDRLEPDAASPVPPLLRSYLGLGAWVCGEPAWDPAFGCADVPVLLAMDRLDARFARHALARAA
jgi:putative hemolysin